MCVLLCANPKVYRWLDPIVGFEARDAEQLAATLAGEQEGARRRDPGPEAAELTHAVLTHDDVDRIPRGQMLRVPEWVTEFTIVLTYSDETSLHERKNPLDTLTDAWRRLLSLVGLR